MPPSLRYFWPYLLEVCVWLALIPSSFSTLAFLVAKPTPDISNAAQSGSTWEVAINNHGALIPWYSIQDRPWFFISCAMGTIGSAWIVWRLRIIQSRLMLIHGQKNVRVHKLASALVFLAVGILLASFVGFVNHSL